LQVYFYLNSNSQPKQDETIICQENKFRTGIIDKSMPEYSLTYKFPNFMAQWIDPFGMVFIVFN